MEILDETVERLEPNELSALEALGLLFDQEQGTRETRRIRAQFRTSRLLQGQDAGQL